MADSRTRSKVILDPVGPKHSSPLQQLVVPNIVFVLGLGLAKNYLVFSDADALWLTFMVFACGAIIVVGKVFVTEHWKHKSIEWPVVGFASFLLCLRVVSLFVALVRMRTARIVILTHFSSFWMKSLLNISNKQSAIIILCGILLSLMTDAEFHTHNIGALIPAYTAVGLEALSSSVSGHTRGVLLPSLGSSMTDGIIVVVAFIMTSILYVYSSLMLGLSPSSSSHSYSVIIVPLIVYALFYTSPALAKHLATSQTKHDISISLTSMMFSAVVLGLLVFAQHPRVSDFAVAGLLYYGMISSKERVSAQLPYTSLSRVARAYLKSILENPESRKIFYFLVLNMCYMLVQMLYGIWTNSLGLISDAIHMAFDCMAIGVGLIASVMARWAPNERFTYGYARIETLSGFSNGIFLILISIFIVFEAIERLVDPPEMNTSQLLLVSSLGLCVNLFGMFAMGGHHHGGHSHSHSHGHSHLPSTPSQSQDHQGGHSHSHTHGGPSLRVDTAVASLHAAHHTHTHPDGVSHSPSNSHCDTSPGPSVRTSNSFLDTSASQTSTPNGHADVDSHTHSHSYSHLSSSQHEHSHSHLHGLGEGRGANLAKLLLQPQNDGNSPLTPNYRFEHDVHYEQHHAHDHGPNVHDHAHLHDQVHEGHSHNMRGVFLHVMADTLGSVGVIISTLLIQFYGWTGFDPIASLFIALLIAASVVPLVIDTGKVLMLDLSHQTAIINKALSSLHHIEGLQSFSSAHFWPKDDNTVIGSIHVHISPSLSHIDPGGPHSAIQGKYTKIDQIVERVDAKLRSTITGLEELTIQVEGCK